MQYRVRVSLTLAVAVLAPMMDAGLAVAAPFNYVANEKSGAISIIDVATDGAVCTIKTVKKPRGLAIGNDGKVLYVSDQSSDSLIVIDLEKKEVAERIKLQESPGGVSTSLKATG